MLQSAHGYDLTGRVYHVWAIFGEFLGHNFVCDLRTIKSKTQKPQKKTLKPKNIQTQLSDLVKWGRRMCTGRLFYSRGPAAANARSPRRKRLLRIKHLKVSTTEVDGVHSGSVRIVKKAVVGSSSLYSHLWGGRPEPVGVKPWQLSSPDKSNTG